MAATTLDRRVLSTNDAAWQLGISNQTLGNWLEGYTARNGRNHPPVLRETATGEASLTWGEYVEAFYLTAYRFHKRVPMQRLRPFVEAMRQAFQLPYPLAHLRPYVDESRQLLLKVQDELDLPDELWMVFHGKSQQLVLNPTLQMDFLSRVEFEADDAQRIFPFPNKRRLVIDPRVRSGTASIEGVPASMVAKAVESGDTIQAVAETFDLDLPDVELALSYALARAA